MKVIMYSTDGHNWKPCNGGQEYTPEEAVKIIKELHESTARLEAFNEKRRESGHPNPNQTNFGLYSYKIEDAPEKKPPAPDPAKAEFIRPAPFIEDEVEFPKRRKR